MHAARMAKQLVLSDSGRLETHDGNPVTLTALLGGAEVEAFTQTYSTATTTVPAPTSSQLTHTAVGGTANGTLVDCTSSYSEAAVEENFKELATMSNLIQADVVANRQLINALIDYLQAAEDS